MMRSTTDPFDRLLRNHNDGAADAPEKPDLLIVTCMDPRIGLRIPPRTAYVLRSAGAAPDPVDFDISVAVARAGVGAIAVIAHTDCAMASLDGGGYVAALEGAGWSADEARALFERNSFRALDDEAAHAVRAAERLRARYPTVAVAPFLYDVADDRLHALAPGDTGAPARG